MIVVMFTFHLIPTLYLTIALWNYTPDPKDDSGLKYLPIALRNITWILFTWFTIFQIIEAILLNLIKKKITNLNMKGI